MKRILDIPCDRSEFVDCVRMAGVVLVILIHVTTPVELSLTRVGSLDWWVARLVNSFSHIAVPLFVMASGALLLHPSKTESISAFLRKRAQRIIPAFLFWSVVYLALRVYRGESVAWRLVGGLVSKPAYYHLWYVYMLIGLYLATPVLRVLLRHGRRAEVFYVLALWIAAEVLPVLEQYAPQSITINVPLVTRFVGLYVCGSVLSRALPRIPVASSLWLPAILLTSFDALLTYLARQPGGHNSAGYGDAWSTLIRDAAAVLFFLSFRALDLNRILTAHPTLARFVRLVSDLSLWTYMSHVFVLELLWSLLGLHGALFSSFVGIPFSTAVILIVCLLSGSLVKRLPYARCLA